MAFGRKKSKKKVAEKNAPASSSSTSSDSNSDDEFARRAALARAKREARSSKKLGDDDDKHSRPRRNKSGSEVEVDSESRQHKSSRRKKNRDRSPSKGSTQSHGSSASGSSQDTGRARRARSNTGPAAPRKDLGVVPEETSSREPRGESARAVSDGEDSDAQDTETKSRRRRRRYSVSSADSRGHAKSSGRVRSGSVASTTSLGTAGMEDDRDSAGGAGGSMAHLFVEVIVIEGRNLASKDSNGFSDPYVTLRLEQYDTSSGGVGTLTMKTGKQKTRHIPKTLTPQWNDERFSLSLPGDTDNDGIEAWSLHLECFDSDKLSSDDFMGQADVALMPLATWQRAQMHRTQVKGRRQKGANARSTDPSPLTEAPWRDLWLPLRTNAKNESVSGEIRIRARIKEVKMRAESTEKALKKFRSRFSHLPSEVEVETVYFASIFALKSVPMQGTLYVTNFYVLFYANALLGAVGTLASLGKKKKVIVKFTDVVDVVRADSALLIPNSIKIHMEDGSTHYFSGFWNREKTFSEIRKNWKAALALGRDVEDVSVTPHQVRKKDHRTDSRPGERI
jgi:hypothetical protein